MKYTVICESDVGRMRSINQDAVAIKHISTSGEEVVFAVLCDGMGGFNEGEVASSSVVMAFMKWFDEKYTKAINAYNIDKVFLEWKNIVNIINDKLYEYGNKNSVKVGTTATVMLICNTQYYILNIGDCRVYELSNKITQLTNDHSVVEREIELGRITREEARYDKRRNQLLRSIGVLENVSPDFFYGEVHTGAVYMLCCDGVRNKVFDDELLYYFHPEIMTTKSNMENNVNYIFALNKMRNENDNMTVVLIKDNDTTIVINNKDNACVVQDEKIIVNSDSYLDIELDFGGAQ